MLAAGNRNHGGIKWYNTNPGTAGPNMLVVEGSPQ